VLRTLGIDYGDRHIGLAMSDALGLTAQPFGTYELKAADAENKRFFRDLVAKYEINEIVIGNPLRMDGTPGTRSEKTRQFADWLEKTAGRPIILWDERLTTRQALQSIGDGKLKGRDKKDREDQIAALIILSTYMESKRSDSDVPQDR
jgi:putative holliday junction resolvase